MSHSSPQSKFLLKSPDSRDIIIIEETCEQFRVLVIDSIRFSCSFGCHNTKYISVLAGQIMVVDD